MKQTPYEYTAEEPVDAEKKKYADARSQFYAEHGRGIMFKTFKQWKRDSQ